jgi:hypothetical protein
MALELIAAIVAAVALAGIAHLARRLSGYRLPRWLVPFAGGLGLIGFTVWSEYDWFNRVSAELPPGVEVVWTESGANPMRPWTYLAPMTTRFVALDRRDIARHPVKTELRLAHIYNFARWKPTEDAMMVFDCAANRQVLLTEAVTLDEDGTLRGSDWVETTSDDAFHEAACREG